MHPPVRPLECAAERYETQTNRSRRRARAREKPRIDDASVSLYEEGPAVKTNRRIAGGVWVASGAHFSVAPCLVRRSGGSSLRWRISHGGPSVRGQRHKAPAGVEGWKGWLRVSMCQIASASLRAITTLATLPPRFLPSRSRVRSYRGR